MLALFKTFGAPLFSSVIQPMRVYIVIMSCATLDKCLNKKKGGLSCLWKINMAGIYIITAITQLYFT